MSYSLRISVVVMISATVEWRALRTFYPDAQILLSPFGEWFVIDLEMGERVEPVLFFHGGWGKIAAAASAQYVIDHRCPSC